MQKRSKFSSLLILSDVLRIYIYNLQDRLWLR